MSLRVLAFTLAALGGAASLAAQQSVVLGVYGGVYNHFVNLNSAGTADFGNGYNIGATLGYQFNRYIGVHGDFTYSRNTARGTSSFTGVDFNRFFVGGHVEFRYPSGSVTPFAFAGAGAMSVDPLGTASFNAFTKLAGNFGLGLSYTVPRSPVDIFVEGKNLVYKWDRGGFNRTLMDVSYALGFTYRWGW